MKNINKKLIEETKTLLKTDSADSYFIWKSFDQGEQAESNVYYFSLKIFQALVNTQKKNQFPDSYESMLSTLLILEFYKNTKNKPESLISESRKLFSQNHMKLHDHGGGTVVIDMYLNNSGDSNFTMDFISYMCHAPKKISWKVQPGRQFQDQIQSVQIFKRQLQFASLKQDNKPYKILKNISFYQSLAQSKVLTFSYVCFLDYIKSSNGQIPKATFIYILDVLKGFFHSLRVTNKTYNLAICFLFFLKNVLTFYGCKYDQMLKQMIYMLNLMRNFSGQIAYIASQLFVIVHQELKTKGITFRKRLRYDFAALDLKNSQTLSKKVYALSNRAPLFNTSQYCMLNNLRKMFIYNILGCCDPENIAKYWRTIEGLDGENVYKIYYKISKIVQISQIIQSYSQIQKLQKESIVQFFKTTAYTKGKVLKQELQELGDIVNNQHSMKYFSYPVPQIIQLKIQQFQSRKHQHSVFQMFQNVKLNSSNQIFYQNSAPLVLIGDDYQISRWISSIAEFLEDLPLDLYQKWQVFVIPVKNFTCSISQFIASKDLWYKRFVYNVFHQKILYPDIQLDENTKDIFPNYLFNKSLQMYIREAQRIFPYQLYKCYLKIDNVDTQELVYFCSHILIGSSAELQIIKTGNQKSKKYQSFDLMDYYLEKVKKINPLSLDLMMNYRQPNSVESHQIVEKNLKIEDLQICNTPRQYFMGNTPNPAGQTIQISILTQSMGKVFRKQLQNKQVFKRNNEHEIKQAFKDLFINMSVQQLIISNTSNQSLRVIIDGAATNKVQKIRILPARNKKQNYPLRIPIKTFLPFQFE